ncbi:hypothetical protein MFLO_05859 [Listeria floridensis FSL S10-1187]|uniref:Uncharacterized protein n=1 Tax=Listeria floridensis FSL S10-1187 TaxID=1265817 RepID=A0ABN0RG84_9LIST|nr:hypothetical protein [Listeria floridensis]EUJ32799.1 hypothetical protein MFLO_05859 [Listeria floridensis FSL S10-1187]
MEKNNRSKEEEWLFQLQKNRLEQEVVADFGKSAEKQLRILTRLRDDNLSFSANELSSIEAMLGMEGYFQEDMAIIRCQIGELIAQTEEKVQFYAERQIELEQEEDHWLEQASNWEKK